MRGLVPSFHAARFWDSRSSPAPVCNSSRADRYLRARVVYRTAVLDQLVILLPRPPCISSSSRMDRLHLVRPSIRLFLCPPVNVGLHSRKTKIISETNNYRESFARRAKTAYFSEQKVKVIMPVGLAVCVCRQGL